MLKVLVKINNFCHVCASDSVCLLTLCALHMFVLLLLLCCCCCCFNRWRAEKLEECPSTHYCHIIMHCCYWHVIMGHSCFVTDYHIALINKWTFLFCYLAAYYCCYSFFLVFVNIVKCTGALQCVFYLHWQCYAVLSYTCCFMLLYTQMAENLKTGLNTIPADFHSSAVVLEDVYHYQYRPSDPSLEHILYC